MSTALPTDLPYIVPIRCRLVISKVLQFYVKIVYEICHTYTKND